MISAVILTKNEEKNIRECIESLTFCDEVVVIDDNSDDATREKAKKMGAKVFIRDMDMDYSAQSNFGMKKADGEWVLFVDADERISDSLKKEIIEKLKSEKDINGYNFKRVDYMWGSWLKHGEIGAVKMLRLVKKGFGRWERRVHPIFEIDGETSGFKNPILHFPHPTLSKFLEGVNRWSDWDVLAKREEGKKSSIFKIIFWPAGKFFYNFVLRAGFLDGMAGFIVALVMSFHSFLSWSKVWIAERKV